MMKIFLKEKLSKKKKLFQFEKKVPPYQSSDGQVDYLMGSFPFKIIWNNHWVCQIESLTLDWFKDEF